MPKCQLKLYRKGRIPGGAKAPKKCGPVPHELHIGVVSFNSEKMSTEKAAKGCATRPEKDWTGHEYALLGWLKSSFMMWYCAAFLGSVGPFIELQFRPFRIPIPRLDQHEMLSRLKEHSHRIISLEMDFMGDLNRLKKKGTLDREYQEKARRRHNSQADKIMLALDQDVFEFLKLEVSDTRFIAKTISDLEMSDFGLLEALRPQEGQS